MGAIGPCEIPEPRGAGGIGEVYCLDPRSAPLRDDPRFKKLVGEDWQAEATP